MSSESWGQVKAIVYAALQRETDERNRFLDEACREDEALRKEVESLLAYEKENPTTHLQVGRALRDLDRQQLASGELINGRYEVIDVLGEGGMGVVYRVADRLRTNRELALKTLLAAGVLPSAIEQFRAEFKTCAALRHPNVAQVYDFETLHGRGDHFFTMELVRGRPLLQAIEGGGWATVLDPLVQVCRALAYVHSRQIIHGDLKPANILVDSGGAVKVLDFGIARAESEVGGPTQGTPDYMAPEMTFATSQVDHRADLYSLGILAYRLICGRLPFSASTLIELRRCHHFEPIGFDRTAICTVPAWLRTIVDRLCAKQPADRYRTANGVIEDINAGGGLSYELETQQTRESYILSSRFVGREEEVRGVTQFVEARTGGRRGAPALFVSGASGIGKSRLFREVRHIAQLRGIKVVEASCYEGSLEEYGPIAEILSHVIQLADAAGDASLLDLFGPELAKLVPSLREGREIGPSMAADTVEAEQLRLRDQVCQFLAAVARRTPYVVFLGDMQWAKRGTTDIVEQLERSIAIEEQNGDAVPLAILGNFRASELRGTALVPFLDSLERVGRLRLETLLPLEAEDVEQILTSMLGVEELPLAFVKRVVAETAGVPFFVEEVMRALVENGSVYLEQGAWSAAAEIGDLQIPTSMEATLRRRVALLESGERTILELMVTYGRPIPLPLLHDLSRGGDNAVHSIKALTSGKMVTPVPGDPSKYQITHDRLRETVYADLEDTKRRDLHRRIGTQIERAAGNDPAGGAFDLAYHFRRAHDDERALRYCRLAADRAIDAYANDIAIEQLQHALRLLAARDPESPELRVLREQIGDCEARRGRHPEARAVFSELKSSEPAGLGRARLNRKIAETLAEEDRRQEALDRLWQSISELRGGTRPTTRLRFVLTATRSLLQLLMQHVLPLRLRPAEGSELIRLTEIDRMYAYVHHIAIFSHPATAFLVDLRRGVLARRHSSQDVLAEAEAGLSIAALSLGLFRVGLRYAERALSRDADSPRARSMAEVAKAYCGYSTGDFDQLVHHGAAARQIGLEAGDMFSAGMGGILEFGGALYTSDFEHGARRCDELLNIFRRTGSRQFWDRVLMVDATLAHAYLGDLSIAETEERLTDALVQSRKASDHWWTCAFQVLWGVLRLEQGDPLRALELLTGAIDIREKWRVPNPDVMFSYPAFVWARIEAERVSPSDAEAIAPAARLRAALLKGRRLRPFALRHNAGWQAQAEALYSWHYGRRQRARRQFARARQVFESRHARRELASCLVSEGRCLLETGDSREATPLLEEARSIYSSCGARPLAALAERVLEAARGIGADHSTPSLSETSGPLRSARGHGSSGRP